MANNRSRPLRNKLSVSSKALFPTRKFVRAKTVPASTVTSRQPTKPTFELLQRLAKLPSPVEITEWPYRRVLFVHGIEWLYNRELKGFSQDLQTGILSKFPIALRKVFNPQRDFVEALWSDVVEVDERRILKGLEIVGYIATGNFPLAVKTAFAELTEVEKLDILQPDTIFSQFLGHLLPGDTLPPLSIAENAASALLDVILYFTPQYGPRIRDVIREALQQASSLAGPPVVFAHSLGTVAIVDIILDELAKGRSLPISRFVTAGSPLALFTKPEPIGQAFAPLQWENYYDPQDFVSTWNPLKDNGFAFVSDYAIKVEVLPVLGHLNYWKSETTASAIISAIFS